MKKAILACLLFLAALPLLAKPQYTSADSAKVVKLLLEGKRHKDKQDLVLFFARKFLGVPYVASTLENNTDERLVINLRQLDCTTFVENVLTLTLCTQNGKTTLPIFATNCEKFAIETVRLAIPHAFIISPNGFRTMPEWASLKRRKHPIRLSLRCKPCK